VPENYIGRHYDTHKLPDGIGEIGGSLLRLDNNMQYALTKLMWTDKRRMWWLEKLVCRDENGSAFFEIVDTIASPPLSDNDTASEYCYSVDNNESTSIIYAVGINDNTTVDVINGNVGYIFEEIKFAFRLDLNLKKFISIKTEGLTCLVLPSFGPEP